jgi:hypothetical protein
MAGFKIGTARNRKKMVGKSFDDGQIIQVTYMPSVVTLDEQSAFEDKLAESGTSDESKKILASHLKRQITEWNLEDDSGSPLPIEEDAMGTLPWDVLDFIMNMLKEDKDVGKQKGNNFRRRS